jgi:hypothetical protein
VTSQLNSIGEDGTHASDYLGFPIDGSVQTCEGNFLEPNPAIFVNDNSQIIREKVLADKNLAVYLDI